MILRLLTFTFYKYIILMEDSIINMILKSFISSPYTHLYVSKPKYLYLLLKLTRCQTATPNSRKKDENIFWNRQWMVKYLNETMFIFHFLFERNQIYHILWWYPSIKSLNMTWGCFILREQTFPRENKGKTKKK